MIRFVIFLCKCWLIVLFCLPPCLIWLFCLPPCLIGLFCWPPCAAPVPVGDVPAVCKPETVLPQQLALLPDNVSISTEEQGQQDVQGCPWVTVQACLVSWACVSGELSVRVCQIMFMCLVSWVWVEFVCLLNWVCMSGELSVYVCQIACMCLMGWMYTSDELSVRFWWCKFACVMSMCLVK